MANQGYQIVSVGDVRLSCIRSGDDVWVEFARLCEALSLDRYRWADELSHPDRAGVIGFRLSMAGGGGGSYHSPHIHYRSIPSWLIMLKVADLARMSPADKARVLRVQREAADAIERRFFGSPEASSSLAPAPAGGAVLDMIIQLAQEIKQDRADVAAVRETANRALAVQVLAGHAHRLQVRVCCAYWRLRPDEEFVRSIGTRISREARAEGWYHEVLKDRDSQYLWINNWPEERILPWFTREFGPCPDPEIRELVQRCSFREGAP